MRTIMRIDLVLLVIAGLLTAAGIGFNIAAFASPGWEVVLMREFQTEHQHGLWLDCARNAKPTISNGESIIVYGKRHCTYKFDFTYGESAMLDDSVPDAENITHLSFKAFHIAYLIMIGLAVLIGTGTIFCMVAACRNRHSVAPILIFTAASLFSTSLSLSIFVSYYFVSHSADNRWVKGVTSIYDTDFGDAYYFEQYATFCFFSAFAIGMFILKLLKYFVQFKKDNKNRTFAETSAYLVPENNNKQNYYLPAPYSHKPVFEYDAQLPDFLKNSPKSVVSEPEFRYGADATIQADQPNLKNSYFPKPASSISSIFAIPKPYEADTTSRVTITTSNSQTPLLLGLETMV